VTETFAERLRRLRHEQGYTAVDLATAVGASEGTIRQLESGNVKSPNFHLGIRLADRLQVDPRYLALGEGVGVAARFDAIERRLGKLESRVAGLPARRR
jgi:transcriptional regulator with XRE-family HTH domain